MQVKKKQPALRRKKTAKPSPLKTKQQEALSKAAVAVTDFAKSDLQEPPKGLVDAVNRYLSVLNRGRKRKPIDTIVPHRKILVGQIVIHCIWALDEQQLVKAEKTLLDIASCFARTYRMGNEWMADMAFDEQTDTAVIDKETAAAFRKGDLTMLDIIRKHHKSFSQTQQ